MKSFLNLYGSIQTSMTKASKAFVLWQPFFNETELCPIKLWIVLYVDDLVITCKDQSILDIIVIHFRDVYKEITVHTGEKYDYFGACF